MKPGTHMNYLALNQNILNKPIIFGSGPKDGDKIIPIQSKNGLKIYLNGTHKMPEFDSINELFTIGQLTHPHAMIGMPDCEGELKYEFGITDTEYLIIVRLKLNEENNGESDFVSDILTLINRNEIPENIDDSSDNYFLFCQEMLFCHFDILFQFYDTVDEIEGWDFNGDALLTIVNSYFETKKRMIN
jgi:hypothetical protein